MRSLEKVKEEFETVKNNESLTPCKKPCVLFV